MNPNRYFLPDPVGKLLSLLPLYPGSLLFAAGLNLTLNDKLPADVTQRLIGKKLRIQVMDARLNFDFRWANGGFSGCRNTGTPD
jgi:O2-independent ubiquinone biosynthesis accessory factor UbiT